MIVPGVGAFGDGMKNLAKKGLIHALNDFVLKERPLLGICLGISSANNLARDREDAKQAA